MWLIVFICLSADSPKEIFSPQKPTVKRYFPLGRVFFNVLMFILMSVVLIHVVYVYSGAYAPYFGMK